MAGKEMSAIRNSEGQIVGYRGVKYKNGKAIDTGTSYNANKEEVPSSQDAIARRQSINRARRANPRVNPLKKPASSKPTNWSFVRLSKVQGHCFTS